METSDALSRALRLAVTVSLATASVTSGARTAWADDDEADEDEGGEDTGAESGEDEGQDEEEDPKDQPAVTSGGLFTIATYPVRELHRPLTLTTNVTQLRLALGSDVSDKTAFTEFGVSLEGRYGLRDNVTLLGAFTSDYNFKGFSFGAGFEGALAYDLFDIRLAANINRVAQIAKTEMSGGTLVPTAFQKGSGVQLSVDLGFPFRYVARKEIAIIALETLVSFDFNAIKRGNGGGGRSCLEIDMDDPVNRDNCTEDGAKPDLAPSLGIATNPVEPLSVVLFAQLQIRDFDTTNQFTFPATLRAQFSPNRKLDIGLEFKFLDLKPKDPDADGPLEAPKFFAQRFLNMFVQARY